MKKVIVFISLLIIVSIVGHTQGIRLGIKANPQLTWLNPSGTNDVENTGSKMGIDIGLAVENYFTANYALLTGLSLSTASGILDYTTDTLRFEVDEDEKVFLPSSSMKHNFQYISIPLGLKFKTNEIGYFTYYAQLGFSGHVNVKATLTESSNDIEDENISKEINLFNVDYFIGGGVEYSLGGNASIVAGITYHNGFIDIVKTTEDKIVLSRVALRLGVMF